MLLRARKAKPLVSRVWLIPDLSLGFHHFDYSAHQYDGLDHTHGEYCIVIGLSGAISIVRGERVDRVETGDIVIVNPGELHRCRFGLQDTRSEGLTLIVRPQMLRSVWDAMFFPTSARSRSIALAGSGIKGSPVELGGREAWEPLDGLFISPNRFGRPVLLLIHDSHGVA
jgi:hypothetical protein